MRRGVSLGLANAGVTRIVRSENEIITVFKRNADPFKLSIEPEEIVYPSSYLLLRCLEAGYVEMFGSDGCHLH